jgi:hypothetical protein
MFQTVCVFHVRALQYTGYEFHQYVVTKHKQEVPLPQTLISKQLITLYVDPHLQPISSFFH